MDTKSTDEVIAEQAWRLLDSIWPRGLVWGRDVSETVEKALREAELRAEAQNARLRDALGRISLFQEIHEGRPGLWFCRLCGANGYHPPLTHRRDCPMASQVADGGGEGEKGENEGC